MQFRAATGEHDGLVAKNIFHASKKKAIMITRAYILSSLFSSSFIYQVQKIDASYLQMMIDGFIIIIRQDYLKKGVETKYTFFNFL